MHFVLTCMLGAFGAARPQIPVLDWEERSDWINVKADVDPRARGDGIADDTAAIQAALDTGGDGKTVYLPPGTYRITRTLTLTGPVVGALVVGHGRSTRLVWDGPPGGRMYWSNGAAYTRYVGLTWDGRGKAAVGVDHASKLRFETELRHQHEAFLNFTGYGIRIGHEQKLASAEILYSNCLFENCGTGVAMLAFNDYNNTFDGCEFRNCGTAVHDNHGNFYARNCHFEGSAETDFFVGSEHGDSIRRCTSVGSRRFVVHEASVAPLTIQDCHIAGWANPDGAVLLGGAPVLMFDCVFTDPPTDHPPVRLVKSDQRLALSGNESGGTGELLRHGPAARITTIPPGDERGVVRSARQRFLKSEALVPGEVFDAKQDFGAKGDGRSDDTDAIQAAIDAARDAARHGRPNSIAYLPTGQYKISRTLSVTGRGYSVGGSGFRTAVVWNGAPDGVILAVHDPMDVTVENLCLGHSDLGKKTHAADIRQTSSGRPSRVRYEYVFVFGMYQKKPSERGLQLVGLPGNATVHAVHVQGNLRITGCSNARILFRNSYEGTITVEGRREKDSGLLGFMTRLATLTAYTLHVRDSRSVVMSDFYVEQADGHFILEGNPGDPAGQVTIQGPKTHLGIEQPLVRIRDYCGRISLGPSQYYFTPAQPRFLQSGTNPVELTVLGSFFYNTKPLFQLGERARLTAVANEGLEDSEEVDLAALSAALDHLRKLGRLDFALQRGE